VEIVRLVIRGNCCLQQRFVCVCVCVIVGHDQVILQTQLGQLMDLTSAPVGGPVDLNRFTIER
jgi:hypothetical protein